MGSSTTPAPGLGKARSPGPCSTRSPRTHPSALVRVEDAPATREDSAFSFISNEIFVGLAERDDGRPLATLAEALERVGAIGAPDYADDTMLQYLRVERVVPPYQTRGVKVIEMVRVYQVGKKG